MNTKAKFVREIEVEDPDSKDTVHMAVYKHENGGMFAVDSSYVEQVLAESDDGSLQIYDPFADVLYQPRTVLLED